MKFKNYYFLFCFFLIYLLFIRPNSLKGQENLQKVIFTEIFPNPALDEDKNEWFEIKNISTSTIDLSDWSVEDLEGKTTIFYFQKGTKIAPDNFLVLSRKVTKIVLNNSADGLVLKDNLNNIIDTAFYRNSLENKSYCKINNEWQWCNITTLGKENVQNTKTLSENDNNNVKTENKNLPKNQFIEVNDKKTIFLVAMISAFLSSAFAFYLLKLYYN